MDYAFILDCVKRSRRNYEQASGKYKNMKGYYKDIYSPTMLQFKKAEDELKKLSQSN